MGTIKDISDYAIAGDNQCEVVLVGCGCPKRGMGWYHAVQMIKNKCPSAKLCFIVEPWFMGAGKSNLLLLFSFISDIANLTRRLGSLFVLLKVPVDLVAQSLPNSKRKVKKRKEFDSSRVSRTYQPLPMARIVWL